MRKGFCSRHREKSGTATLRPLLLCGEDFSFFILVLRVYLYLSYPQAE
jgi:hypothetical protein